MSLRPNAVSPAGEPGSGRTAVPVVSRVHGAAWRARVADGADSTDPRRQAQAHAEVLTAEVLRFAGWSLDLDPSGRLVAQDGARTVGIVVLPFRFGADPSAAVRALVRSAVVRADLPWSCLAHVRRAGTVAADDVTLDALTQAVRGWTAQPERTHWVAMVPSAPAPGASTGGGAPGVVVELVRIASSGAPRLAGVYGPSWAHRAREVVEPRIVEACIRRQRAARVVGESPFLLACVADRAWPLTGGWWRECLYGRPAEICSGDTGLVWSYTRTSEPALYRDASLPAPAGVLCIGTDASGAATVTAHAHPWEPGALGPDALRVPGHDRVRGADAGGDRVALRWYEEGRGSLES